MGWFDRLFHSSSPAPASDAQQVSRRDLLTGSFLRALRAAPSPLARVSESLDRLEKFSDLDEATPGGDTGDPSPILRPPGAVDESEFLSYCSRCGDCERACPHQAILMAPERHRLAAGTPMVDPSLHPCLMCPDTPCITACPPAVLYRAPDAVFPVMGTARITTSDCLAWQGMPCSSCHDRCPASGAITLDSQVRPTIQADLCTGCGVCQHVCPAPQNAIIIIPEAGRPAMPFPS